MWCNANHTKYIWKLEGETVTCCMIPYSVMDFPSGSGKRLFINGVGLEDGFVSECLPIFCL